MIKDPSVEYGNARLSALAKPFVLSTQKKDYVVIDIEELSENSCDNCEECSVCSKLETGINNALSLNSGD